MPKHKSEDYKLSAVNYYLTENNNQLQTCKIFKCSRRSLMRWVNRYKQSNKILRQNRKPVSYKLQKHEVNHILKLIENNKTILSNVINDNNITLKLTRFRHEPKTRFRKPIYINKQIQEFYNKVKQKVVKMYLIAQIIMKYLKKILVYFLFFPKAF